METEQCTVWLSLCDASRSKRVTIIVWFNSGSEILLFLWYESVKLSHNLIRQWKRNSGVEAGAITSVVTGS